jgi:hypothetical protein
MLKARSKRSRARKRSASSYHAPPPAAFAQHDDCVLTFSEWCALNRISQRNGRRIIKAPGGPRVLQLSSNRIGITKRANKEWQASRERTA